MVDAHRRLFLRGRFEGAAQTVPVAVQRPPWAGHETAFTQRCTRCHACISACPQQVLRVGDGGFPQVDFSREGCDFCGACAAVCEPRAIDRQVNTVAWPTWKVHIDARCLALNKVECRICADACDARALRFVPAIGGITSLQVLSDHCTGCGECAPVCPVGAITLATAVTRGQGGV